MDLMNFSCKNLQGPHCLISNLNKYQYPSSSLYGTVRFQSNSYVIQLYKKIIHNSVFLLATILNIILEICQWRLHISFYYLSIYMLQCIVHLCVVDAYMYDTADLLGHAYMHFCTSAGVQCERHQFFICLIWVL